MKVGLVQTDIRWNQPAANVVACRDAVARAVETGAELVVLPEMFTTGFSLLTGEAAREAEEAGRAFLADTAEEFGVYCIGSTPEVTLDDTVFNTAWVYSPDGLAGAYRKIHLFSFGAEHSSYSPGVTSLTISLGALRCSIFVCYDLRFPQPFAALASQTDLFVVVANWPAARREHWLTLLRARAIENQAFVAGVNRVGEGGGLEYSGDSCIFAPDGTEVAHLRNAAGEATVDLSPETVAKNRESFPTLKDRRPAVYAGFNSVRE